MKQALGCIFSNVGALYLILTEGPSIHPTYIAKVLHPSLTRFYYHQRVLFTYPCPGVHLSQSQYSTFIRLRRVIWLFSSVCFQMPIQIACIRRRKVLLAAFLQCEY